ncbi:MAG: hypothetical protein JKY37_01140, partial [Nannocystaceae bacterium]|nr:hypothetical protein [Nannocystaceae bacterium]
MTYSRISALACITIVMGLPRVADAAPDTPPSEPSEASPDSVTEAATDRSPPPASKPENPDAPTRQDMAALRTRLDALEQEVETLRKQADRAPTT